MIKYKVHVGYHNFVFDDAETAVDFALKAKRFNIEDSFLRVNITFVDVDAEDPEDD